MTAEDLEIEAEREESERINAIIEPLVKKYYALLGGIPVRDVRGILYEGVANQYDDACGGVEVFREMLETGDLDGFEDALDYMENRELMLHQKAGTLSQEEQLRIAIQEAWNH